MLLAVGDASFFAPTTLPSKAQASIWLPSGRRQQAQLANGKLPMDLGQLGLGMMACASMGTSEPAIMAEYEVQGRLRAQGQVFSMPLRHHFTTIYSNATLARVWSVACLDGGQNTGKMPHYKEYARLYGLDGGQNTGKVHGPRCMQKSS